ncbi:MULTISPECIES: hypothetical protein [Streptomyces]|uniref:Endonuclease/exonuclease/phosphatase family protein n=1 Tax=Streptomyces albus (strain ATCC 21838 / DSM 41398 / FERM P-419 / JCM 4703 / NBRC 107858) TaxID=1081613 RepID=H6D598_STRA4|nr:hypothetical protein [Streptomyces sp. SCSIO ZS0520]AEZ53974.1 hypothetical protein [Streptomyces albus]AJE80624.1 hypothetical protein SLNWT_0248 [Streptomyces albus]AOU74937.1 hypothetical protein SLNHY_0246 [Streptomyces albus]AYN30747.1 hypothetical protein DUI70_0244 [Streptomyces albus]
MPATRGSLGRLTGAALLTAAFAAPLAAHASTGEGGTGANAPAAAEDRTLRVYSNNIENLVRNNSDGSCTRISGPDHLSSLLVDDSGKTGTAGVKAPDLLIVQQIRGRGQADAYADQLSAKFGLPKGTYKTVLANEDPEEWGGSHHCSSQDLGNLKKKQTNGILYNSQRLNLASGDVADYWSAGWLKPGTAYADGQGCTLYKPPNADEGATNAHKWRRTSAIAARFTVKTTGTSVFAATMHLPQENSAHACAGDKDKGIGGTGIHLGADATRLMNASTLRVVGMDANRSGIPADTLSAQGMTGYGAKPTHGTRKIDYLFVRGTVAPSPVDHTVNSTKSNHLGLYAMLTY